MTSFLGRMFDPGGGWILSCVTSYCPLRVLKNG